MYGQKQVGRNVSAMAIYLVPTLLRELPGKGIKYTIIFISCSTEFTFGSSNFTFLAYSGNNQ